MQREPHRICSRTACGHFPAPYQNWCDQPGAAKEGALQYQCNANGIACDQIQIATTSMPIRLSPTGIPYFDDGSAATSSTPDRRTLGQSLVIFLAVFIAMQALWHWAENSIVERLLVDHATVKPAAVLVNLLTPDVRATAIGTRLSAPGGGINILNGCEGAEVAFLLLAGFLAVRLPWRSRLMGLLTGGLLIYGLNQVRILALFYAYRTNQALFDALHGMVAPVILIAATGLFFHLWVNRTSPPQRHAGE